MKDLSDLRNIILTPYIQKALALIGVQRIAGGNQFRHSFATLGILLDYKYTDPVLLKGSILHDLFEDIGEDDIEAIRNIDNDGPAVVALVLEVTRRINETKLEYMARQSKNSTRAKILKCADRISNLTDMHLDTHAEGKILSYLSQTETYVIPLAKEVNNDFVIELTDLIKMRRKMVYELTSKNTLTDEEFVDMMKVKHNIDYNIGDIVWFKDENVRCECGLDKFEVISFEPTYLLCNNIRCEAYLTVNLKNIKTGNLMSYLTSHIEKFIDKKCPRTIIIDDVEYDLIPKKIIPKNENDSK